MKLPLNFVSEAQSPSGLLKSWHSTAANQTNVCAVPPEFNGPGGGLSPEDLFSQALMNCLVGTFKVYAENSKLSYSDLRVQSDLLVDMNEEKKVVMKSCHFKVRLFGVQNPERAELLIKKAFQSGFILNSVKTQLSYDLDCVRETVS